MIFVELLYTHELKAKSKINDVVNVTGQPTAKEKTLTTEETSMIIA